MLRDDYNDVSNSNINYAEAEKEEIEAIWDSVIGLTFCVGIVAVYIPQHLHCWRQRSAHGLSLWTILLCTVANVTVLLTRVVADLDSIQNAYHNSHDDTTLLLRVLRIVNAATPCIQNLLFIATGIPTYVFYYFGFGTTPSDTAAASTSAVVGTASLLPDPDGTATSTSGTFTTTTTPATPRISNQHEQNVPQHHSHQHNNQQQQQQHRWEVIATGVTWVACGTAVAVTVFVLRLVSTTTSTTPRLLLKVGATTAAVTKALQWLPQLEHTWTAGHEGVWNVTSLSAAIVVEGVLAWYYYGHRHSDPHWQQLTFWATPTATLACDAVMQALLLGLVLHYRRQRQQQQSERAEGGTRRHAPSPFAATSRPRQRGPTIGWNDNDTTTTIIHEDDTDNTVIADLMRRPLLQDAPEAEHHETVWIVRSDSGSVV